MILVLMTIFVVKLYKKGCSVITILKTFCIQKIKNTLLHVTEAGCFAI